MLRSEDQIILLELASRGCVGLETSSVMNTVRQDWCLWRRDESIAGACDHGGTRWHPVAPGSESGFTGYLNINATAVTISRCAKFSTAKWCVAPLLPADDAPHSFPETNWADTNVIGWGSVGSRISR